MSKVLRLTFKFICYEKKEKIILSKVGSFQTFNNNILSDYTSLGYAFCSLLNCVEEIEQFKLKVENNISKYIKDKSANNAIDNIRLIFNELIKINKYLVITENTFTECAERIAERVSFKINRDIVKIIEIYKNYVSSTLDKIIKSISHGKYLITHNKDTIHLPPSYTSFKVRHKKPQPAIYEYTLSNIDELIRVSYYHLMLNKYHIKQCIYPNCNKYFFTLTGQTRYCENPCPADSTQTCRSIRKNYECDSVQEPWEYELSNLEKQLTRVRTRYYDNRQRSKNIKQKELISNNYEKLKRITNTLKTYIKGASEEKRVEYLQIYKDFLNEVETNLNSSPCIFKIKKPII